MDSPILTLADLQTRGVGQRRVRTLVDRGELRRVARGAYVDASVPDSIDVRAAACARVLRPHQVVVDRTAAWLHGVDAWGWGDHDVVPIVEVCAIRGRASTRRSGLNGGERDLATCDIEEVGGIAVTTPLRTALDLGCRLRRREAFAALNDLVRTGAIDRTGLDREVRRFKGRRGVVQLRELVPLIDSRLESTREAWVWLAMHDAGLPPPTPQVWVGDGRFRLDFAYPRLRIAIEYDGQMAHGPERARLDRARRDWLRAHGWELIVVRSGDFTADRLDRWLDEVRTLIRGRYDNRRW